MISVNNLSKKYSSSQEYALKNVSFHLDDGEMIGLIGQNGAGKSTLLKAICKFITPTEGQILFDGIDIVKNANSLKDVGILLEPVFYPQLTAYENLAFYLDIHGKSEAKVEIDEVLEMVGLLANRNQKPKDFSFGMKQRLGLAQALLGDPKILFLDEPFVGLDPNGVKELIAILKQRVHEKKMQAIISSHQLFELNTICERVLVLQKGELVFDGVPNYNPELTFVLDRAYQMDLDLQGYEIVSDNEISTTLTGRELDQFMRRLLTKYHIINVIQKKSALEKFFEEN